MAANSAIGQVETVYINSTDSFEELHETNVSKGMRVNPYATYQQVDTAARAIAGLTKNTYNDTILVTKISVNEVISE